MMARQTSAADLVRSGTKLSMLAWEAQMVIAMRVMGMMGAWPVAASESDRMMDEKPEAFMQAAFAAGASAMAGGRPDQVLNAWTGSLSRKTGANMRRLSKRGVGRR